MMILKDNTKYSSTVDNLEAYKSLQCIANRQISDLLDDDGNDLLIYPHSFGGNTNTSATLYQAFKASPSSLPVNKIFR